MAKLKQFTLSNKSKTLQSGALCTVATTAAAEPALAAESSSSNRSCSTTALDYPFSASGTANPLTAASSNPDSVGDTDALVDAKWDVADERDGLVASSKQLDALRSMTNGADCTAASNAASDDNWHGKVVVRGSIGDVCFKLVDDGVCNHLHSGSTRCSAEVILCFHCVSLNCCSMDAACSQVSAVCLFFQLFGFVSVRFYNLSPGECCTCGVGSAMGFMLHYVCCSFRFGP
jgi:hypothetical protein